MVFPPWRTHYYFFALETCFGFSTLDTHHGFFAQAHKASLPWLLQLLGARLWTCVICVYQHVCKIWMYSKLFCISANQLSGVGNQL
jgi:hypothetical protein